jgi:hypothetical protein
MMLLSLVLWCVFSSSFIFDDLDFLGLSATHTALDGFLLLQQGHAFFMMGV